MLGQQILICPHLGNVEMLQLLEKRVRRIQIYVETLKEEQILRCVHTSFQRSILYIKYVFVKVSLRFKAFLQHSCSVLSECWSVFSYSKAGDGDQRVKSQREDSLTDRAGVVEGSALGESFPHWFLSVYWHNTPPGSYKHTNKNACCAKCTLGRLCNKLWEKNKNIKQE